MPVGVPVIRMDFCINVSFWLKVLGIVPLAYRVGDYLVRANNSKAKFKHSVVIYEFLFCRAKLFQRKSTFRC